MNFQHLRHFVVTADTGNILKAAETLYISQSGLSRSIGALENMLGLPLFERSAKGVELTSFGEKFYPHAKLLLNEYNRSIDELKTFRELRGGSLRLGINHSFAYFLVPDVAAALLGRWPDINIVIAGDNYRALTDSLSKGDIDLALSLYTDRSVQDDLDYEKLFELRMRVFARRNHPIGEQERIGTDDLTRYSWARINGASAKEAFESYFSLKGHASPSVALQCASVALLSSVVSKSDLLTILPEELVGGTSGGALEPIRLEEQFGIANVALIRRKGSFDSPIAERLSRLIRQRVKELGIAGAPPPRD